MYEGYFVSHPVYVKHFYDQYEYVIVSRIDYDDMITDCVVEEMQSLISDKYIMQIAGYHNGQTYHENTDTYQEYTYNNKNGFVSMFATAIYNTKYNLYKSIYCNHTMIVKEFKQYFADEKLDLKLLGIHYLTTRHFIYVRHNYNYTVLKKISNKYDINNMNTMIANNSIIQMNTNYKSINLQDLEKYSFVITIDDERYQLFKKIFKYHGIENIRKYDGFTVSNVHGYKIHPYVNCQFSHLSLIKFAKLMDWPFVCIFEDDAYPCYDVKSKLEYYLTDIPIGCNTLILGNTLIQTKCLLYDKYYYVNKLNGSHAYIVFKCGYDNYIKAYETNPTQIDTLITNIENTISPKYNLFIQYNIRPSLNNLQTSYIWKNRSYDAIIKEFPTIENVLCEEIILPENKNKHRFVKLIIPCYNCEKTIDSMIRSILNQTYKDFFIVLVDDMSTDNTLNIIKQYEQKYPNYIKAVQVPEKAYADGAREYGFKQYDDAEFTWFVDADDVLIDANVIQTLYDVHKEKQVDIYTFNSNTHKFDLHKKLLYAPWFRIVKSDKVVFHALNISSSDDVIQSLLQYDIIPDDRIYHIDKILYAYSGIHGKLIAQNNNKVKNELLTLKFNKQTINNIVQCIINK